MKVLAVENQFSVTKQFELWQSRGDAIVTTVCEVGPSGNQCRAMLEPDAELIWRFEGHSHLDTMQRYYDYMGFGTYTSDFPDLDCEPYFKIDALKAMLSLPASIKAFCEIVIFADGHTKPAIPSPMPMISIQDRIVFSVGVWIAGNYGGHQENPVNSAALIREADMVLRQSKPHLFKRKNNVSLICPRDIAEQMRWPKNGKPRVLGDAEP